MKTIYMNNGYCTWRPYTCWCNWRPFWRKNTGRGKFTQGGLVLARQCSSSPALATQNKPAYLGFHCLDHPPYSPDLAPSDYHLFPGLKNNWKVAIFHPTWRSLLPCRPGWMDDLLNFFLRGLQKLEQGLRSVLSFVGSMLNKSQVWSL